MPIALGRRVTGRERTADGNRLLGYALAFVAGATNAGAFVAVRQYTSHITGTLSSFADAVVIGQWSTALAALGAVASFAVGALMCALLVNFGRRRNWQSVYATPLLLEAALLLAFGLLGARYTHIWWSS